MKRLAVLGSTGSIGTSSLKVVEQNPDKFQVAALAAGRNVELLYSQIARFKPQCAVLLCEEDARLLRVRLGGKIPTEILSGMEGFIRAATMDEADIVISAMTGAAGLIPTYAAVSASKRVALANKETMVMAGPLVMDQARVKGIEILPIDSEHSAILQSLQGHSKEDIRRVILTASGGPFKDLSLEEMASVTPEQALKHPNWEMGRKITIDSATMMNKGFEAIEAKWLFDLRIDQIGILVHPQSIVHSMVEYMDGSILAQMGIPDMITPISYALTYPRHIETRLPALELEKIGTLSFEEPDLKRFRCLDLALKAAETGGSMPAVLNAANEVAVDSFLRGRIGFLRIPELIEEVTAAHHAVPLDHMNTVLEADRWARSSAEDILRRWQG